MQYIRWVFLNCFVITGLSIRDQGAPTWRITLEGYMRAINSVTR